MKFKGLVIGALGGWLIGYFIVHSRIENMLAEETNRLAVGFARLALRPTDIAFAPDTLLIAGIGAIVGLGIAVAIEMGNNPPRVEQ